MDNVYEKLLEMGYTLSPDGKLFFNGEEIKPYIKTKNGKQSYILTKAIDGKRNYIYLSKFFPRKQQQQFYIRARSQYQVQPSLSPLTAERRAPAL